MSQRVIACLLVGALSVGCGGRAAIQQTGIGQTHLVLGDIDQAEAAFRAAIKADPAYGEAHLGLARCLAINGDAESALVAYAKAAETWNPVLMTTAEAAESRNVAVAACFEAADLVFDQDTADTWVDRLAAIDKFTAPVLRAHLLRRSGDTEAALASLDEAFKPGSRVAIEFAWLSAMEGDFDHAAELFGPLYGVSSDADSVLMLGAELNAQGVEGIDKRMVTIAEAWFNARRGNLAAAKEIATPMADGPNATPWANAVLGYCALAEGAPLEAERLLRLASFELPHSLVVRDMLDRARSSERNTETNREVRAELATGDWRELWEAGRLRALLEDPSHWGRSAEFADTLYVAALVTGNNDFAETLGERLPPDSSWKPYALHMRTAVEDGEPNDLLELVDSWPQATEDDTVLVRNAAARAYAVAQLRARALEQILRCLVETPENGVALYNLATLYREAAMPAHEIGAWRRLLAQHPDHDEAQGRVYAMLVQERRFAEARRAAEAAYVSNPNDMASLIRLADAGFKSGEPDFALAVLERSVQAHPGNRRVARALARGYLITGDGDAALGALERYPNEHDLRAYALAMTNAWSEAMAACEATDGNPILRAALLTRSEQYREAGSLLRDSKATHANEIWANALRVRANADADVSGLALVLATRSDALRDFAFGAAYSAGGLANAAQTHWQSVLDAIGANSELAALMLTELARTGAVAEKVLVARRLTERHAADPDIWILMADIYESEESKTSKSGALGRAAFLASDSAEVWQAIAQRADASEKALLLEAFQNLNRLRPDEPVIQNNLAYALLQSGESKPDPLPLAESAFAALGARSHVLHTLGLALLRSGRVDEGREKLYQAVEQRPGDPTLMLDFGKALIAQGETDEGRRLVKASITYADRLRVVFPRRAEAEAMLVDVAAQDLPDQ